MIKSISYEYDTIEELGSKSSSLYFPGKSFKIYEYISLCSKEELFNKTKSIYINLEKSDNLDFFIYDNYSKIQQNEFGNFINYYKELNFASDSKLLVKLNCNKKYYFIIFISSNSFVPIDFKIFIIDEIKNDIYINPSLSNDFNFFQTSDKPMKLNYKYNETKLSLIRLFGKMKLMIYENNMVLYNHSIKEEYKVLKFKFKKDIEYNITFEDISYNKESTIYFKFFDENKYNTYIKHNFIKSSLYLFNNYEYFIEIDLSKYKLGENFILLIFSNDENNYTLKYQYMNKYENNNLINIGTSRISSYNFNYINLKKK